MQLSRLFEIMYLLVNEPSITAKELAERFEVSIRTIYRDVETLSAAGIPIYMSRGRGGGISLLDHFVLSNALLSSKEQDEVLAALTGLQATMSIHPEAALTKLSALFKKQGEPWIQVDFSDWSGNDQKFSQLKEAVLHRNFLSFVYVGSSLAKTNRKVEPLQLWFKEKSWYLKAYCLTKQEIRVFKLSRMQELVVSKETFEIRMFHPVAVPMGINHRNPVTLSLHIGSTMAFRVLDEFNGRDVQQQPDGSFIVNVTYPEDEWVYQFILSFGNHAKVLGPLHIKDNIQSRLQQTLQLYL